MDVILVIIMIMTSGIVQTDNFVVDAGELSLSREVAQQAESHRRNIALKWTGREPPPWTIPCLFFVTQGENQKFWGQMYHFKGEVRGIAIRGSRDEIFNILIPHEIAHAVMVDYFGDMPRWFDEGIAVSCEKNTPARLGIMGKPVPLRELFVQTSYPADWSPFYAQSYYITMYLYNTYGKDKLFEFVRQGILLGWDAASYKVFGIDLESLDGAWRKQIDTQ